MNYHIHAVAGGFQVCRSMTGFDHSPVPSAVFGKPRDAIRYADMREADIRPVRSSEGAATDLPQSSPLPSERLTPFGK